MANNKKWFRSTMDFIYQSYSRKFNERMKQLEDYGNTRYAYRKASKMLRFQGINNNRMPSIFQGTLQAARRLINIARSFLRSISSSRRGIKKVYGNVIRTLKNKYPGVNFTEDNLVDIFEGSLWEDLRNAGWGSNTILNSLGTIAMNEDEIKKLVKSSDDNISTDFSDSDAVNQFIDDLVNGKLKRNKNSKRSLTLKKLYKGLGQ